MQNNGKDELCLRVCDGKCPLKEDWCSLVWLLNADIDRIRGVLSETDEVETISEGGKVFKLIGFDGINRISAPHPNPNWKDWRRTLRQEIFLYHRSPDSHVMLLFTGFVVSLFLPPPPVSSCETLPSLLRANKKGRYEIVSVSVTQPSRPSRVGRLFANLFFPRGFHLGQRASERERQAFPALAKSLCSWLVKKTPSSLWLVGYWVQSSY